MIDHTAELESKVRCLEAANEQLAATRNEWMLRSSADWKRAQELKEKLEKVTEELSHAQTVITAREETINGLLKAPHIDMAVENAALKQSLETVKAQLRKRQNSAPEKRAAKLGEKVAELEQEIERMRAAKIYQDCNPEATEADLQRQIVQQKENFADQIHQAEGIILEWQEKYKRAEDMINALEAIKARMHGELSQAHQEEYNASRKHEQAQKRIADLEKTKEELTAALSQASQHACNWQEKYNQAQAKLDKINNENNNLAAQIDLRIERVEELDPAQFEAQTAQVSVLELERKEREQLIKDQAQRISELEQEKNQAANTIEDLLTKYQEISAENCNLLAINRELEEKVADADEDEPEFHHDEIILQDQRIEQLENLRKFDNDLIRRYQENEDWLKRLLHNEELEPAHKLALMVLRQKTTGKGDTYTRVYVQELAREMGMKRQAAGRRLNELIEYGAFGAFRDKEEATVPDKRLGTRKIEKELINVVATNLLERVQDLKRTDGKQHGGYGNRCKKCGCENVLRRVYHTVCLHCGNEDILMPLDAQEALNAAKIEVQDEQQSIVVETLPVEPETNNIQDEPQPCVTESEKATPMTLARGVGFPALTLEEYGIQIAAGSPSWSRWMHMSRPTNAQISAVIAYFKGKPAPFDTPCEWCESTETAWDPDGSGRRVTVCYVHPERRKPRSQQQTGITHKAIDFSTRSVVEVRA